MSSAASQQILLFETVNSLRKIMLRKALQSATTPNVLNYCHECRERIVA